MLLVFWNSFWLNQSNGTNGTATYCSISGIDVAAKTGTTNENYDRWLCGFTPYYTAVCWYGFDMNESINFNGKNPAGLIWSSVMQNIHSGLPNANFEMSKGIVTSTICRDSGKVANSSCPNTFTEYFLKGTVPDMCTQHSGSNLNTKTNTNKSTTNNKTVQNSNNTTTDNPVSQPQSNTDNQENNNSSIQNTTNDYVAQNVTSNTTSNTITNNNTSTNNNISSSDNSISSSNTQSETVSNETSFNTN